jgi:hypothetical protein
MHVTGLTTKYQVYVLLGYGIACLPRPAFA